jgi:putative NADH-flavin reductase
MSMAPCSTPPSISGAKTLAIVYGTRGGLSDVGKFALQHALKAPGVTVRALALYDGRSQSADEPGFGADVTDAALRDSLAAALRDFGAPVVDVNSVEAAIKLEQTIRGADAVIACVSSRQPELPRYLTLGMSKIVDAMRATRVERLVCLSSFGIGDDFMPWSPIKVFWACLLNSIMRSVKAELYQMEALVSSSGPHVDYLMLRPVGLTPSVAPTGKYELRTAPGQGKLKIEIAKADVALCMLDEALKPTLHRTAVTIGTKPNN